MLTPPDGLSDEALVSVLADRWDMTVASLHYRAVGFGSHHWEATDAQGKSWFVTVDDLDSKRRAVGEPVDASFDRLHAALATSRDLRAAGCAFVVAPIGTVAGAPLARIDRRFAVALYPHVEGQTFSCGEFSTAAHRHAVLEMIAALHSVLTAAAPRIISDDFAIPCRDELEVSLDPADWESGPFGLRASSLLVENATKIQCALTDYDDLVDDCKTNGAPGRAVVTHGEPHPGNAIMTADRGMLIDWDTVLLALPERDLWSLDPGDGSINRAYTAATGTSLVPAALALFRIRWDLADIAAYVSHFRRQHNGSADDEKSWADLRSLIDHLQA